jgi:adenylate cyclase
MNMHMELVPIPSLLRDVLPTAEILARQNGNVLKVEEHIMEGLLLVDPIRFRQCLLNLISNACKFTEKGAISIQIRRQDIKGCPWVLWSIADTGIGIAPNMLGKLFRTFSQVDPSLTRKFGGSGLGLVISEQFCRAMEGYITVESKPSVGSTFTIHLPLQSRRRTETGASEAPCDQREYAEPASLPSTIGSVPGYQFPIVAGDDAHCISVECGPEV